MDALGNYGNASMTEQYNRRNPWRKMIMIFNNLNKINLSLADPGGCAVYGVGLKPLDCWDLGFEFRRRHKCSSVVFVV